MSDTPDGEQSGPVDELVAEFLVESQEGLDQLNADLVELERDPLNTARLASIFRTVHTIKGTCGFLGFERLGTVAHAAENLLARLRDGHLVLNAEITSALLVALDAMQAMLQTVESTGNDGDRDDGPLIAELERLAQRETDEPKRMGEVLVEQGAVEPADVAEALDVQEANDDPRHVGEVLVEMGKVEPAQVVDALRAQQAQQSPQTDTRTNAADATVRIDVGLLDRLMDLVGELVLARNQLLRHTADAKEEVAATSQRMSLITTELQEGVMKTRMQPIDNVWARFPRTVRDLAMQCGKQVSLALEGRETELDRSIVEAIRDPLTHVIRNSIDHGIETPEERIAAGKPPEGQLVLRAYHEGGRVNIEVNDDGAGIDLERVKAKAVAKGLIAHDQVEILSEREALDLLFLPGFSTAEQVTNVSGRGVGMDVVKTNIERIGGTVEIVSTRGVGTCLKVKIPLTLAIIPALIVTSGTERYAIPQVSLLELVHLDGANRAQLDRVGDETVYRLRGRLLPLVDLAGQLGCPRSSTSLDDADQGSGSESEEALTLVVLHADGRTFGLVVDEVHDTEEIVVKPLGRRLKHIAAFSGATIMGDGRVALILDVLGLAQQAGIAGETAESASARGDTDHAANADSQTETLLLVSAGNHERLAIPLSKVNRIEEVPLASVERAGDRDAVQYRGRIMPLVYVSEVLGGSREHEDGRPLQVVVYKAGRRPVALVVDEIIDTVEDNLAIDRPVATDGTAGAAIVAGQITEVLDVESLTAEYARDATDDRDEPDGDGNDDADDMDDDWNGWSLASAAATPDRVRADGSAS